MSQNNPLRALLDKQDILLLDGAMATELEARGCNLADSLWSAKVLVENPELIREVHLDYYRAGAQCAITASYQATPAGFASRPVISAERAAASFFPSRPKPKMASAPMPTAAIAAPPRALSACLREKGPSALSLLWLSVSGGVCSASSPSVAILSLSIPHLPSLSRMVS